MNVGNFISLNKKALGLAVGKFKSYFSQKQIYKMAKLKNLKIIEGDNVIPEFSISEENNFFLNTSEIYDKIRKMKT